MILSPWLRHFKWYRRKCGGTWYKVMDEKDVTAWHGPEAAWTRVKPKDESNIIEKEVYEKK